MNATLANRRLGSVCTITYDINDDSRDPEPGDEIVTSSGKSGYVIRSARKVRSSIHPNRWSLRCLRVPVSQLQEEPEWTLWWHSRKKKHQRV